MKKFAIAMLLAGSTLLMADGAALFAKCAGCHGQKGEKPALGKSAVITGQDAAKTAEQLKGYKAGTLNQHGMGALMKGQVASMSDDDIKAVSEYIAGLK
jgi:cytochrome c553